MSTQSMNKSGYSTQFANTKNTAGVSPRYDTLSQKSKGTVKTRVVENNIRGRPVDKITEEHLKPENKPFNSIYRQDFNSKSATRLHASQELPRTQNNGVHIVNPPSTRNDKTVTIQHADDKSSTIDPNFYKSEFYTIDGQPIPLPDQSEFGKRTFNEIPYLTPEEAKYYADMRNVVFKIKYRGPRGSVYQKDYVEHGLNDGGPTWKNDFYSTFNNYKSVDYGTINRTDYKDWKAGPVKRETMNWTPASSGIPFAGRSMYKREYVDWGSNKVAFYKVKQLPTVIPELPLLTKTNYREDFKKPVDAQKAELVQMELFGKKSPLSPTIPFVGESMSMSAYKPFKVESVPVKERPKDTYVPTATSNGLFKTTYRTDFNKHSDPTDPRKFMIPKFNFI